MMVVDTKELRFRGLLVGALYKYNTDEIKAVVFACEESLRVRLTFLGFVEEENTPNTYWLINKEGANA